MTDSIDPATSIAFQDSYTCLFAFGAGSTQVRKVGTFPGPGAAY